MVGTAGWIPFSHDLRILNLSMVSLELPEIRIILLNHWPHVEI